jgi:hypothetical protein
LSFLSLAIILIVVGMATTTAAWPVEAGAQPQAGATLDAAIVVIIQATREEQDRRNAVAATRAAVEAEAARQQAPGRDADHAMGAEGLAGEG